MILVQDLLPILVCPGSRDPLIYDVTPLVTQDGAHRFPVDLEGIMRFVQHTVPDEDERQRAQYDSVAAAYLANLGYPHTKECLAYLDGGLLEMIDDRPLGRVAELCCGNGEAVDLLAGLYQCAICLDLSEAMLQAAAKRHKDKPFCRQT